MSSSSNQAVAICNCEKSALISTLEADACQVDVPYIETQAHRQRIVQLLYPHDTEMDLSIGNALYFAARGTGSICYKPGQESTPYQTPVRVLISGLGADELFGGYTRHATAYSRRGFKGLLDELELDIGRLGKRNLGRDDRILSHWGRETRFPFLDENLVQWALSLPVWEKCGFGGELEPAADAADIEPGKRVLRLLAHELGLKGAAREKKRAVSSPILEQFIL